MEKLKAFWNKTCEVMRPVGKVFDGIGKVIAWICKWIMRLRKLILAVPVIYGALRVTEFANENLPDRVGLNLLENGEYAYTVAKNVAVLGPLALTAACLLLMFCSRRTMYPWLICMFTLVLPILIVLTNIYPN